jgi:short-subunit dehydrogenase
MANMTPLVIGASRGVGYELAKELANMRIEDMTWS